MEAENIYTSSLFKSEPLYQFYQEREALQEHIYLQSAPTESGGLLEEIEADPVYQASRLQDPIFDASRGQLSQPKDPIKPTSSPHSSNRTPWGPGPVQGLLNSADQRTLWAELPQVILDQKRLISTLKIQRLLTLFYIIQVKESGVLASLDPGQRRLQEALFEIVSSEASYLKVVLID